MAADELTHIIVVIVDGAALRKVADRHDAAVGVGDLGVIEVWDSGVGIDSPPLEPKLLRHDLKLLPMPVTCLSCQAMG